jgi:hypothetical protein
MVNTRFQEMLRISYPENRTPRMRTQMIRVLVCAVRKISFAMSPHIFNRIHFRRITWQPIDVKSSNFTKDITDVTSFMDRAIIQNQNHMLAQMPQQVPHENGNIGAVDIMGMKSDIQAKPIAVGRHGKTANDRNLLMLIAMSEYRRTSCGSPRFTDIGYEQESAFIDKHDMRLKFLGFFLYVATSCISSMLWPFRPVARLAVPAFDSSIRNRGVTFSIRLHAYTELRNRIESFVRYAGASTSLWSIRLWQLLGEVFSSTFLSDEGLNGMVAPSGRGGRFRSCLSCDRLDTTVPPNSGTLSISAPPYGMVCLHGA